MLTLKCAIKMKWLRQQPCNSRHLYLKWYDTILSRGYDEMCQTRLAQVLEGFKAELDKTDADNNNHSTLELCCG